jgi:hypothetical protein
MRCPAELYSPSPRLYRGLEELDCPFHDGVAEMNGRLRALDLTDKKVRRAIYEPTDAQPLYAGDLAVDKP